MRSLSRPSVRRSNSTSPTSVFLLVATAVLAAAGLTGCASQAPVRAELEPMKVQEQARKKLTQNHFDSDRSQNVSEGELRKILDSPVLLEENARVGIVPVQMRHEVDHDLPLEEVPSALGEALKGTDYFQTTTEVATDWPLDSGLAGLRELAARYRSEYLLLYRHRFVKRGRVNAWGWTWPTVVGLFATPGKTMEMAGVLEATLFDVRTGTILFTAYERVHDQRITNIWHNRHKRREMKSGMLKRAADGLSDKVAHKVRRLVVATREYHRRHPSARR